MATLEELQAARARTIEEIQRRGGKDAAPNYAKRLEEIDAQIRAIRSSATPAPTPTPVDDTVIPPPADTQPPPPPPPPPPTVQPPPPPPPPVVTQPPPPVVVTPPPPPPTVAPAVPYDPAPGVVSGQLPDTAPGFDPAYLDKFKTTLDLGESFGQGVIDKLGLEGAFLGRVNETASPDYLADLENLRQRTATAADPTTLDLEALATARAALQGISASENAALRSAAVADVNRQFEAQKRQLLRYQGGVVAPGQRAAQVAGLGRERTQAQRGLARDLLIENIEQKRLARDAFASLTQSVGSRGDSRSRDFNSLLLSGGQFADSLSQEAQKYNVETAGNELAARSSALLGGIGTVASTLGGYTAEDFQNKALVEALAAKDREIQSAETIAAKTLASQEKIAKMLRGAV